MEITVLREITISSHFFEIIIFNKRNINKYLNIFNCFSLTHMLIEKLIAL